MIILKIKNSQQFKLDAEFIFKLYKKRIGMSYPTKDIAARLFTRA